MCDAVARESGAAGVVARGGYDRSTRATAVVNEYSAFDIRIQLGGVSCRPHGSPAIVIRRECVVRALILQFEPDDPPDRLGEHLTAQGVAWDAALMPAPHPPLSLDGYAMLVALGGAVGANDVAQV